MSEPKTIGVVLSGCGVFDGSEIHEAVICLLALEKAGVVTQFYAPNMELDEIDHITGEPTGHKRQVMKESARISRGPMNDLAQAKATDVAAWVFPGGFGAAKNLSNVAIVGGDATAHPEVTRIVEEALAHQVPIGACCIAPAMLSAAAKGSGKKLKVTIGNDAGTASAIEAMGAQHVECVVEGIVEDERHLVVTAPAYMYDARLTEVAEGIEKMISKVVSWVES